MFWKLFKNPKTNKAAVKPQKKSFFLDSSYISVIVGVLECSDVKNVRSFVFLTGFFFNILRLTYIFIDLIRNYCSCWQNKCGCWYWTRRTPYITLPGSMLNAVSQGYRFAHYVCRSTRQVGTDSVFFVNLFWTNIWQFVLYKEHLMWSLWTCVFGSRLKCILRNIFNTIFF